MFFISRTVNTKKIDRRVKNKLFKIKDKEKMSIIVFAKDLEKLSNRSELIECDCKIKYKLDIIDAFAIEMPKDNIAKLSQLPEVKFIADDANVSTSLDIARQTVDIKIADKLGYEGSGVGIATLDTGVYPHPDLTIKKNRIIAFKDFINKKYFPYDDNGHGTHVAGVAAGDGYQSGGKYKGIAPKSNVIGVKVMDENGNGSTSDIVAGMQWIMKNKDRYNIKIASLSLGSDPDLKEEEDPLVKGVEALWDSGIVVVAAAGNSGPKKRTINSPGISSKVITVGCSDDKDTISIKDDRIAKFSSRGPTIDNIRKPDIVAPGVGIVSLNSKIDFTPNNNKESYRFNILEEPYRESSGTSVATPIVSGAIALLLEKNPDLKPSEIKEIIIKSTNSLKANRYAQGNGLISLKKLLS